MPGQWQMKVLVVVECISNTNLLSSRFLSSHQPPESVSDLRRRALDLAYNLDHDEAVVLLRRAATLAPDDPAQPRTLASVLWLRILYSRGAITVDHYLGSFTRTQVE